MEALGGGVQREGALVIVAILEVRIDALAMFRAYEKRAAGVMQEYGGSIEQTVIIAPECSAEIMKEIHTVRFSDETAFPAYRTDQSLTEMAHLRERSVVSTQTVIRMEGPNYQAKEF